MIVKRNSATKDIKVENATWIQGMGHVYGKKAEELKKGDFIVFNYGYVYTVVEKLKETKSFITFQVISEEDETYECRFKKNRVVAMAE